LPVANKAENLGTKILINYTISEDLTRGEEENRRSRLRCLRSRAGNLQLRVGNSKGRLGGFESSRYLLEGGASRGDNYIRRVETRRGGAQGGFGRLEG
jgi:hypothetical protein